jgi:hypothetical protein
MKDDGFIRALSPQSELLLTSVGPTTESIQERLLDLGKTVGRLSRLTILRATDGWMPFDASDDVSFMSRIEQRIEPVFVRLWSDQCIKYVLGKTKIIDARLGSLCETDAKSLIGNSDILLVPGGNTWQVARGLIGHKETIRSFIGEGMPYIGESAGSVVAGQTIDSARLYPADNIPRNITSNENIGLGLVDREIAVHVAGRHGNFDIPGIRSRIVARAIGNYNETPQAEANLFAEHESETYGRQSVLLDDKQALSITKGNITIL